MISGALFGLLLSLFLYDCSDDLLWLYILIYYELYLVLMLVRLRGEVLEL
jgi:hypothetical protein